MKTRTSRVYRGGSWFVTASRLRDSYRWYGPSYRIFALGFRLVRTR